MSRIIQNTCQVSKMAAREILYSIWPQRLWKRIIAELDLVNDIFKDCFVFSQDCFASPSTSDVKLKFLASSYFSGNHCKLLLPFLPFSTNLLFCSSLGKARFYPWTFEQLVQFKVILLGKDNGWSSISSKCMKAKYA